MEILKYTILDVGGITGYTGIGNIEYCFNIGEIKSDGKVGAISGILGGSGLAKAVECKYNNTDLEGIGESINVSEPLIDVERDISLNIQRIKEILSSL